VHGVMRAFPDEDRASRPTSPLHRIHVVEHSLRF
jgi:hypothetical protein